MTITELLVELKKYPQDYQVIINCGYDYCIVTNFTEVEEECDKGILLT